MLSRREVKKRIKEQRPLPDEVLVQYPELFKDMEIKEVKVARNPSSPSTIKRHVRKHLDEDQREYRKMIADDAKLRKWIKENPHLNEEHHAIRQEIASKLQLGTPVSLDGKKWYLLNNADKGKIVLYTRGGKAKKIGWNDVVWYDTEEVGKYYYTTWVTRHNPRSSRYHEIPLEASKDFDKRSFRTITQPDGTEVTIGCPKGKFDAKRKRCKVGTRAQRVLKPKRRRKNPGRPIHTVKVFSNGEIEVK